MLKYIFITIVSILVLILSLHFSNLDFHIELKNLFSVTKYSDIHIFKNDVIRNVDEILELRYNDDYIEEEFLLLEETDSNTNKKSYSFLKDFINLFIDNSNKSKIMNIHKYPNYFVTTFNSNVDNLECLENNICNERPAVLNTVLKNEIDELYREVNLYKEMYSNSEIQRINAKIELLDEINDAKKDIRRYTYS